MNETIHAEAFASSIYITIGTIFVAEFEVILGLLRWVNIPEINSRVIYDYLVGEVSLWHKNSWSHSTAQ